MTANATPAPLTGADLRAWRKSVPAGKLTVRPGAQYPYITQREAATRLGCSYETVRNYEQQPQRRLTPGIAAALRRELAPTARARRSAGGRAPRPAGS